MTLYTNGKMKCIIAIVIITAYYPNTLSLTVTSASQSVEVQSGFASIVVNISPNTVGVTGNWTISDMSGNSKKIVIDDNNYMQLPSSNSFTLMIMDTKTSDIGFYIFKATDGVDVAENTPITFTVTGVPPKVSTSMSKETVDIVTSKYGGSVATNPLTIKNIDINDLGVYWCEVENNVGTGESPYITIEFPQGDSVLTQAETTTATSIHGSTSTVTEKGTTSTVTEKVTKSTVTEKVTTMTDKGEDMCPCNCDYRAKLDYWATQNVTNYTFEELKIILKPELDKLEKELRVDKQNLSAVIRKLTSAHDKRPSARHLGSFGIQITASIREFGEVSVGSYPCELSVLNHQDIQTHIMVALPIKNIESLSLKLQKYINTDLSKVRGCSLLPDGRMVFSCRVPRKIRVLKSDGTKSFEMNNIGDTFDVVPIGDDLIAVTSGSSNRINTFNMKNKKIKKTIKGNSDIDGAVYNDGHLIHCSRELGLQAINLKDEIITTVTNKKLSTFAYVTTFGEKLFYTNSENNSVTCCDLNGNLLWTFCHPGFLVCPFGLSVDNDGNVFVVGWSSHNVLVISPDGQHFRQRKDGLMNPQAIHYDKSTNRLLVSLRTSEAWLFKVN
ncbi:unnamed protein product [Mytilus edulis]|uniref:Uncharacterized protein n=1 Tax=Mytilus edulis TaxID=6550 RepID=A0A8S3TG58_MYTED|nr:unnamed protein product [Mytilus edulis]